MRRTLKQLAYDLFMISRAIHRDRYYRHQATGNVYKVTGFAILEATGEPLVLYRPAKVNRNANEHIGALERPEHECVFARRASEFEEATEWFDGEISRAGVRFKEVNKVESWTDV